MVPARRLAFGVRVSQFQGHARPAAPSERCPVSVPRLADRPRRTFERACRSRDQHGGATSWRAWPENVTSPRSVRCIFRGDQHLRPLTMRARCQALLFPCRQAAAYVPARIRPVEPAPRSGRFRVHRSIEWRECYVPKALSVPEQLVAFQTMPTAAVAGILLRKRSCLRPRRSRCRVWVLDQAMVSGPCSCRAGPAVSKANSRSYLNDTPGASRPRPALVHCRSGYPVMAAPCGERGRTSRHRKRPSAACSPIH